jgi:SAM-dependent methyltransferase
LSDLSPPSTFFCDHIDRLGKAADRGRLLDLACGRGRHALALAQAGISSIGIDRSLESLRQLRALAEPLGAVIDTVCADLESPPVIPLPSDSCAAVLVFRYLHRPLAAEICRVLAPGGLLIYETFTAAHTQFGYGPRNPDFLLEPGELPKLFESLEVLEQWEGIAQSPRPAALGQLVAQKR